MLIFCYNPAISAGPYSWEGKLESTALWQGYPFVEKTKSGYNQGEQTGQRDGSYGNAAALR
jgi:hypothetical protein